MSRLIFVAVLTAVIHMINTLIYSVRLSGVRTRRLATALSLFNVIFLIASTANLIQAPLMSSIVEMAINRGMQQAGGGDLLANPYYRAQLAHLNIQIRQVMLAATAGTLVGAFLIPPFVSLFTRAILLLEDFGNVPRMLMKIIFSPRRVLRLAREVRLPAVGSFRAVLGAPLAIPRYFLAANVVITGVWTTGVLSALYAGALIPHFRSTATLTSGIVNGVAAVLAATVVDPTAALITDQAMRGKRPEDDVKQMAVYLAITRLVGTLLAQAIFIPGALVIRYVASLIT